ncbi:MAG TPA: PAS domain S-box protein, partial [Tichowtungia sp.]|nr:PAS domain S-box protein [Tichowtungia sp.]
EKELRQFRGLQGGLIALVLLVGGLVAMALHLYEKQKKIRVLALQRSEENLSITLTSIGDGVMTFDVDGRVTRMNPVAEKLTGWSQGEAVGRPVDQVFHIVNVHSRKKVENPGYRALSEGTIVGLANHTVLIHRDSTETQIADSASPIRNFDGEITGVVLVFRDVTELYAKEDALRKSEEKYRTFFENSADAMLIIEDGQFVGCNAATVRMLGYDRKEDLLNIRPSELSPETQPDGQLSFEKAERLMALAKEQGSLHFEWTHLRKDRSEIPIEVSLTAIEGGQGMQLHTIWRDLTSRKHAEKALREGEERFRAAFESTTDHILIWDREYNYLYANQAAVDFAGTTPEQVIGQNIREGLAHMPEFMNLWMARIDQVIASGQSMRFQDETRIADKTIFSDSILSPLHAGDGSVYAV